MPNRKTYPILWAISFSGAARAPVADLGERRSEVATSWGLIHLGKNPGENPGENPDEAPI